MTSGDKAVIVLLAATLTVTVLAFDRGRHWVDAMPVSMAASAPTLFDVPGIPVLRPMPVPRHFRRSA